MKEKNVKVLFENIFCWLKKIKKVIQAQICKGLDIFYIHKTVRRRKMFYDTVNVPCKTNKMYVTICEIISRRMKKNIIDVTQEMLRMLPEALQHKGRKPKRLLN